MAITVTSNRASKVQSVGFSLDLAVDGSNSAYAAGDVVGNGAANLADAVMAAKLTTLIARCKSAAGVKPPLLIYFFSANPSASTFTDNAALSIHANDMDKVIGIFDVAAGDYVYPGNNNPAVADLSGAEKILVPAAGSNLYAVLVANGIFTLVAGTDITLTLGFEPK